MNIDKYLKITKWAKNRYTKNGVLILSVGFDPSHYIMIERLAFKKYMA